MKKAILIILFALLTVQAFAENRVVGEEKPPAEDTSMYRSYDVDFNLLWGAAYAIQNMPGVEKVEDLTRYHITVKRGNLFPWSELEPRIIKLLRNWDWESEMDYYSDIERKFLEEE